LTSSVLNSHLISDPTIRPAGFNLRRSTWSLLNQFRTGQGRCAANIHKWRMAASDKCQCGEVQTMSHIVESGRKQDFLMATWLVSILLMITLSRGCKKLQ